MTHDLTTPQQTASEAEVVRPILLARLAFDSGVVLAHTGVGDVVYDSETYLGVGGFGSISAVNEGLGVKPFGIQFILTGVDPALIAKVLADHYQGEEAKLMVGLLDSDHSLIGDPVILFVGRMDTTNIEIGETATIVVTAESRLVDWARPKIRRYSHEDQQDLYPDDLGFEFVATMVEKDISWGRV